LSAQNRSRLSVVARAVIVCLASAAASLTAAPINDQREANRAVTGKPQTILFMCPHGAAKSVLASAYFQRLAKERGLNVRVTSAGTQPDGQVAPAVAAHLITNGYAVPVVTPRQVTPDDVATADVVISIGCDLKGLPAPRGALIRWDDVPSPSENLASADEAIRKRVIELIEELVRKQGKR